MLFLRYGQIKPQGWLKKQLELQSEALSGHLDLMWPDVRDSQWIGGAKEGWERVPYWLDGFIPLAYILDDEDKKARAQKYIDSILERQQEDGWLCPCKKEERNTYDVWALFLISKVLVVYADCSGDDKRIEDALYRAFKQYFSFIKGTTLFGWAGTRWYEGMIALKWLYDRKREDWIIELAKRIRVQGFDYRKVAELWSKPAEGWSWEMHVVNAAMAIKGEEIYSMLTGEKTTGEAEYLFETLMKYHGTVVGHFNGDECLSGKSPVHGTELCGVAEAMYSYEWLFNLTGDKKWADRLEMLAYNAFPATISDDMWTHQYVQLVNQISCMNLPDAPIYSTNGNDANAFGLEPFFGCCTANHNQGWPKFVRSLVVKDNDCYRITSCAPFEAKDGNVIIKCQSEYPFRNNIKLVVENGETKPLNIKIALPDVKIATDKKTENKDGYIVFVAEKGQSELNITLEITPTLIDRPNNMKAVKYGNLIFSLPIAEKRNMREYIKDGVERKFPYCDYDIYPASSWGYAFKKGTKLKVEEVPYETAFSRKNPPLKIKAEMLPIEWGEYEGHRYVAKEVPEGKILGDKVEMSLQPYGATTLRMTEMPEK